MKLTEQPYKHRPVIVDSDSSNARAHALLNSPGTTPGQDRAAAVTLACHARDVGDLRLLLQACGLLPYEAKPRTGFQQKPQRTAYRRPG